MKVALTGGVALVFTVTVAHAADCPPGSVFKSQDGFTWCEPTVCTNDSQCTANEVCRPVALCMQVGTLGDAGSSDEAGKRLVVTQRCGPDKMCPQQTTCSDLGRCVTKADAERMGILAASPSSSSSPTTPARKSSCGCQVPGLPTSSPALLAAAPLALLIARGRRRTRRPATSPDATGRREDGSF